MAPDAAMAPAPLQPARRGKTQATAPRRRRDIAAFTGARFLSDKAAIRR
jgi:hypothetical protein